MSPLIEIKNVPIEIEMKISHAELKYTRGTADLEISKDPGKGMQIKSKPIKVNMDTFQSQGFVVPAANTAAASVSHQEKQRTYRQATASHAQQSHDLLLNAKLDQQVLGHLAMDHSSAIPQENNLESVLSNSAETSDAEMNIRFEMDKLNFDMRLSAQEFEFTPGDIEFTVSQRPEVIITYVGGPIYVPPSSDPDYEPVDVQA